MKSRPVSPKIDVRCDVCGEDIVLERVKLKSKHFPDGIHIDYFVCGRCGAKYVTLVTDGELRKAIRRRGFKSSDQHMKSRVLELKMKYSERVKEL
ncbi:MAG: hypothetical protein NC078_04110 [Ruminococcus sp.]|nr:hypothetical protein [Ruminococcus sp.]